MILQGDVIEQLQTLDAQSIHTCVTSPPYWGLRDYGVDGQIGLEETPELYVEKIVEVFREVKRVLRDDGTLWLNLGDSYASYRDSKCSPQSVGNGQRGMPVTGAKNRGRAAFRSKVIKHKDLVGIPWMVAFALRADGWYLRSDIIWNKTNPMPESVTDRPTKAHEYIFLLSKSQKYYYDNEAIKEPSKENYGTRNRSNGKYHKEGFGLQPHTGLERNYTKANKRTVWTVSTKPYKGAHFATFPPNLIKPCILAGAPPRGTVLDPFFGSGTTGAVAQELDRQWVGIEINAEYVELAENRMANAPLHQLELI